ncbi:MAG: NUDIX hydrolase [Actinomycetales bacterium]
MFSTTLEEPERLSKAPHGLLGEHLGLAPASVSASQLHTYDAQRRDPRGPTLGVAWWSPIPSSVAMDKPSHFAPADQAGSMRLAFGQAQIVSDAVARLEDQLQYTSVAAHLCGPSFTMAQLRHVYEVIWNVSLDAANFHRKVIGMPGFVESTGRQAMGGPGRPALLYRKGTADQLDGVIGRP